MLPNAGHSKEAGTVSLEALAQGRHRVVEAISGEGRRCCTAAMFKL